MYESENSRNWNRNRFPKLTEIDYFHLFTFLACEMTWMVLFHVLQALCLIILTEIGNNLLEAQGKDIYKLKSKLINWWQPVYKTDFSWCMTNSSRSKYIIYSSKPCHIASVVVGFLNTLCFRKILSVLVILFWKRPKLSFTPHHQTQCLHWCFWDLAEQLELTPWIE